MMTTSTYIQIGLHLPDPRETDKNLLKPSYASQGQHDYTQYHSLFSWKYSILFPLDHFISQRAMPRSHTTAKIWPRFKHSSKDFYRVEIL